MTPEARKTRSRIDADGVKVTPVAGVRRGVWLIALALLLVGVAGLLALRVALRDEDPALEAAVASPAPPVAAAGSPAAPAERAAGPAPAEDRSARPVRRTPTPPPPLPPGSTEAPRAEPPSLPELSEDGARGFSGIGVYPPPGTDPTKIGLLVPEDYVLPEGYVRHYQATDDGEPLPAILMFHPDFVWLDENGNQIPLPDDLIVPPEMAPPGMPKNFLDPPKPRAETDPLP